MTPASQWKKSRILGAADPGEQVFVPAGESDHLVGEDRSDDDKLVVVEDPSVDLDRNLHAETPAGDLVDLVGLQRSHHLERFGIVPFVIEELHRSIGGPALLCGDLQPFADGRLAHRLVGAERHDDVQGSRHPSDLLKECLEEQSDGCGSGAVRNHQQNPVAPVVLGRAGAGDDLGHLRGAQ